MIDSLEAVFQMRGENRKTVEKKFQYTLLHELLRRWRYNPRF
jgi:hypothetical protein